MDVHCQQKEKQYKKERRPDKKTKKKLNNYFRKIKNKKPKRLWLAL